MVWNPTEEYEEVRLIDMETGDSTLLDTIPLYWIGYGVIDHVADRIYQWGTLTEDPDDWRIFIVNSLGVKSPEESVEDVIEDIEDLGLDENTEDYLTQKLYDALDKLASKQYHTAINMVNAFINRVDAALRSGKVTQEQADALFAAAEAIMESIEEMME